MKINRSEQEDQPMALKPNRYTAVAATLRRFDELSLAILFVLKDSADATADKVFRSVLGQPLPSVRARLAKLVEANMVGFAEVASSHPSVLDRKYHLRPWTRTWLDASLAVAEEIRNG